MASPLSFLLAIGVRCASSSFPPLHVSAGHPSSSLSGLSFLFPGDSLFFVEKNEFFFFSFLFCPLFEMRVRCRFFFLFLRPAKCVFFRCLTEQSLPLPFPPPFFRTKIPVLSNHLSFVFSAGQKRGLPFSLSKLGVAVSFLFYGFERGFVLFLVTFLTYTIAPFFPFSGESYGRDVFIIMIKSLPFSPFLQHHRWEW